MHGQTLLSGCDRTQAHPLHLWTTARPFTRLGNTVLSYALCTRICPGTFPAQRAANPERTTL